MNPSVINTSLPRTWRDIAQPIKPRAMSREGRRRRAFAAVKIGGLSLALVALAWGGVEISSAWQQNPGALVTPAGSAPVRTITLRTDGVLDAAWLRATLALPPKASLMALDLAALQARLRASGQVQTAELTRQFPDTLVVALKERAPVARVLAQLGDAPPEVLLVARDGNVFADVGHTPDAIARLPFLDGVRLVRAGAGFAPIEGMASVAGLLDAARGNAPEISVGFRVVSLARLASDGVLVVKTDAVREITFGAHDDFQRQLARLDFVLDAMSRQAPGEPLGAVNLAVGGSQVPVARVLSVAATAARGAGAFLPIRSSSGAATPAPSLYFPPLQLSANSHDL